MAAGSSCSHHELTLNIRGTRSQFLTAYGVVGNSGRAILQLTPAAGLGVPPVSCAGLLTGTAAELGECSAVAVPTGVVLGVLCFFMGVESASCSGSRFAGMVCESILLRRLW